MNRSLRVGGGARCNAPLQKRILLFMVSFNDIHAKKMTVFISLKKLYTMEFHRHMQLIA